MLWLSARTFHCSIRICNIAFTRHFSTCIRYRSVYLCFLPIIESNKTFDYALSTRCRKIFSPEHKCFTVISHSVLGRKSFVYKNGIYHGKAEEVGLNIEEPMWLLTFGKRLHSLFSVVKLNTFQLQTCRFQ